MKKIYTILFLLSMLSCAVMAGNRCNPQLSTSSPGINVPTLPIIPGSRDSIILPFFEDWTAGNFDANNWSFDPDQSNWSVTTSTGNPAPSAQFGWSPQLSNYNFALVSDTIDATAITDNVTLKFDINLNNFSTATLEGLAVEVFDGTTWQMVHDYTNANGSFNWISESYNITQWTAGHTFKVRFRAYGADSYNINYWYVDNIKIYQQVTGNFTGTVTRLLDGSPVAGATITMTNALSGSYTTTTVADGSYAFNGIEAGIYALTLEKEGYNVISEEDTILGNQTATKDYQLTAPTIAVVPDSISITIPVGQTTTRDLTITNSGNGPLAWSGSLLTNKKQVSIPASNGNFEHSVASTGVAPVVNKTKVANTYKGLRGSIAYGFDVNNGIFMSIDTDDPSNTTTIANVSVTPFGGTFDEKSNNDFMYIIDYNDGAIKKVEVTTGDITIVGPAGLVSGDTPTGLTCDKTNGTMYATSTNGTESLLYTINPATGASTIVGPTGIPALIDIAIDGEGQMYGYDIVGDNAYKIDKATGTSTLIGFIGFDASYAQGMCWDPESDAIYMAAYNASTSVGELRLLDKVTGNTAVIGSLPGEIDGFAFPSGCCSLWAFINPSSGIVEAGQSQTVTVTFDGNYIPPQKDPLAGNLVFHSDPDVGQATVALYMTILSPWTGKLNGVVSHGTAPMEGVTVTATREESPVYVYSMVTGADGAYSFDPVIYGTYDITAVKDEFNPYSATGIEVVFGQTTVHNIAMVAPTMAIDPLSITELIVPGQIITRTIHITNNGDGALGWTADVQTNIRKQASIPASDGNFAHSFASSGVAPVVNKTNVTSAYKGAKGSIGYGFDVNNEMFISFDMDDPSNPTIIAPVTVMPFGGTFDATHTDFMYIIDYNDGNIKTVDISTGNVTTVGPAGLQSGDTPTGLTCDKTNGTLYATSTNGTGSLLYSVDPATGAATVIGATGIPALIDIAIDGDGQMYGYDIVGDNAYMIDKTSGTSTLIGSIGFNAGYAQGMCWDPASDAIYMAAYNAGTSAGELRLFDKTTGNTAVIGSLSGEIDGFAFPGGNGSWLTVNPRHGIVSPGTIQDVTVTLDGNYIPPQKISVDGTITFTSDPNVGTVIVPVTLIPHEDYGTLTGTVTHNGIPVAGVTLNATYNGMSYVTTSGNNGVYTFENLVPSTYSVTAEATGYNLFSTTGVIIEYGQTTTLPINLTAPTMDISPDSLAISLNQGETGYLTLHMFNGGDGMLEWHSTLITNLDANGKRSITPPQFITEPKISGSATGDISPIYTNAIDTPVRALWDVLFSFNGNYTNQPGVETDGQYIYTSSLWVGGIGSWFHKYDMNGNWIEDFDIAGATGIRDLAYDGQYFYGGGTYSSTIFQMDFTNKVLVGSINTSVPAIRHIAYDSQNDGFWVGGWSDLQLVDRNGSVINSGTTGLSGMDGSAYDPWTIGGPYLWIFDQGGNGVDIHQYNIANGALTGVMHNASDIPGFVAGSSFACGLCISNTAVPGKIALIGNMQNDLQTIFAYDLGGATPWITITPTSGTLAEGTSQDIMIPIDATNLSSGIYTASITFTSDPNVGTIIIPVTLHVQPVAKVTIAMLGNIQAGPVSVPVHASNIINMGSFQFSIEYDPALLTYTGTSDWYPGIDAVTVGEPIPGHLTFVWAAETQGINIPDGNFFNIDFTWNGVAGQASNLIWSDNPTPREFGDYDGNIFVPLYVNGLVSGNNIFNSTVSIENITVPNGSGMQTIAVPVHAQFGINPDCFQFTIEYSQWLLFQGVTNWNPSIVDSVMVEEPTPGHITFQWCAETQGLNITDGHFFDLLFQWPMATDVWMTFPIIWSDDPMPRNFSWDYGTPIPVSYINGSASGEVVGGINKTTKESVKIYPNPASDYLNVEVGNDICKINVINNLGITVYEQNITGDKTITLNTSGYRAGNYIVQLITKDGQTINRKMMKQ